MYVLIFFFSLGTCVSFWCNWCLIKGWEGGFAAERVFVHTLYVAPRGREREREGERERERERGGGGGRF